MTEINWLLEHGDKISLVVGLLALTTAFIRGWVVPGWVHKNAIKDCEYWKETSQRLINNMERTINVTEALRPR